MSKISKACDISPKVRKDVLERDDHRCVLCGKNKDLQIAHFIPRSKLGIGIPQNLVVLCTQCHFNYDDGYKCKYIKNFIESYLKAHYPDWNKQKIIYGKGG